MQNNSRITQLMTEYSQCATALRLKGNYEQAAVMDALAVKMAELILKGYGK